MKVAIIGGGINGLFTAWKLSQNGFDVDLYDSDKVLSKTSSASSKLLHGGIRYLEQGHVSLVRESLIDRSWWLKNAPEYAKPINMIMPVYKNSPRSAIVLYTGALMYRILAGKYSLGPTKWRGRQKTNLKCPEINDSYLLGSVSLYDAQMDEQNLGNWVRQNAESSGVKIYEHQEVLRIATSGEIALNQGNRKYTFIVNAAGPWVSKLLDKSNINSKYNLTMIRGSHILINNKISNPYIFQEPLGKRIIFVVPYLNQTLIGTTEISQSIDDPIECSQEERRYLLNIYNTFFTNKININDIKTEFSGLRPIVTSNVNNGDISAASRECEIEIIDNLINIYGGKWTSAPSLSKKVVKKVIKLRSYL